MLSIYRRLLKLEFWRWKHVNYPILGLFALVLAWDTATQILLKIGVSSHGQFPMHSMRAVWSYLAAIATEPFVWLGVLALILAFLTWLAIIARVELSKAHPATSFSYVTVTMASGIFLHESISLLKICGIFLIMLGVYLVAE
ncbi:MAG TPA: EamA family transporter [Novimethylophilus sp.]